MIEAIIFDFDYTLVDSSKGVIECANYALGKLGLPPASDIEIKKTIGYTLPQIVVHLAGEEYADRADDFRRYFVEKSTQVMAPLIRVLDPVPDVLRILRECGYKLGIVSTKYRYRIEEILQRESMTDYFDVVIGGEDVMEHKPHPEGLLKAVDRLSLARDQIVFVGDSVIDAGAAGNAEVKFVATLTGVTPKSDFDDFDCSGIIDDLTGLPKLIAELNHSGCS